MGVFKHVSSFEILSRFLLMILKIQIMPICFCVSGFRFLQIDFCHFGTKKKPQLHFFELQLNDKKHVTRQTLENCFPSVPLIPVEKESESNPVQRYQREVYFVLKD